MSNNQILNVLLSTLTVGAPQRRDGLVVYPIHAQATEGFPCLTLKQATRGGRLRIDEVGEAGSVPELVVANLSESRVFLLDGEVLVGAKQNRVLDTSVLVERGTAIRIPVSCVERGRWDRGRAAAMAPGGVAHPGLRGDKASQVHENLRGRGEYRTDQVAVWASVERSLGRMGVSSPTESLHEAFRVRDREIQGRTRGFDPPRDALGVAAVIGGRIECIDVFATPELLVSLWPELLASYALQSLQADGGRPSDGVVDGGGEVEAVRTALRVAADALPQVFASPGLGVSLRHTKGQTSSSALVAEGRVIHWEIFPTVSVE